MVSPKLRNWFLGLTLIALLAVSTLVIYSSNNREQALNTEIEDRIDEPSSAVGFSGLRKDALDSLSVVNSTPLEHDQLAISAALEGTHIDGALSSDAQGNLILNLQIRDFFDYFLSIADDVGPEQAIAEIQRYSQQYLPEPANTQALELLGNYLRYKQTEFQIQQAPLTQSVLQDTDALVLLRASFAKLKTTRQSLFNQEQDQALFGLEDSYANHTLSTLELMADSTTTDEYKQQQLALLEAQLPPALSESFEQTKTDREQQKSIEAIFNSEVDDTQAYEQLSGKGVSKAQVDSIVSRRQQQRNFNETYERYKSQKRALDPNSDQYSTNIDALRARLFADPESLTQAKLRDLSDD